MRFGKLVGLCLLAATTLGSIGSANAQSLNIDFGSEFAAPSSAYGAAASQAGVWNHIVSTGLTPGLSLLNGAGSGVSATVTTDTMGGFFPAGGSDTGLLRGDNFFTSGTSGAEWNVTISNLTNGFYDVYYYSPTNTSVQTRPFTVNGIGAANLAGNFGASLTQGQDWDVIFNVPVVNNTLVLESNNPAITGGLAGLQIVQSSAGAPEPASVLLLGLTMLGGAAIRKRFLHNGK